MKFEDFVKALDGFDKAGYSVVNIARESVSDCYVVTLRIPVETVTKENILVSKETGQPVGLQVHKP